MEEFPSSRVAKLKCGHRMCTACLKKKFKSSMSDVQQMPPRCCTMEAIAPKHVDKLFDLTFKQAWNHRFHEASTASRIYCPSPRCGQWIKSENMFREDGREFALCGRCRTKVCCLCNGKAHASRECPRDERTMRFLEAVRSEGRQNCYKCKSAMELEEGRNHMVWYVIPPFSFPREGRVYILLTRAFLFLRMQPMRSRIMHDLWDEMGALRLPHIRLRHRRDRPCRLRTSSIPTNKRHSA